MPAREPNGETVCSGIAQGENFPQYAYNGEVAISGISGRMPESDNMQEFRDHLMNKEDMVTSDNRRWEVGKFICISQERNIMH